MGDPLAIYKTYVGLRNRKLNRKRKKLMPDLKIVNKPTGKLLKADTIIHVLIDASGSMTGITD